MTDSLHRALVSVRSRYKPGESATVFARAHQAQLGKAWSFDIAEPTLTGAELLLGLLINDVIGLFLELCRKQRVVIDEVEATGKASMANPLTHLGVIGASGTPHYGQFTIKAYLGTGASAALIAKVWEEALSRAPLANTLKMAAPVNFSYQII